MSGLTGSTDNWIEFGPSHLLGYRTVISRTSSASPNRSLVVGGLRPDAEYYFRPVSAAGDAIASWYCGDSAAGVGYVCDGPDAPPRFRTAPAPGERPVPPAEPETVDHPFPEIDGQTFMVQVDDRNLCLDLQAQLAAAAAADASKNHEVVIPAGAVCYGEFVLPRKLGPGIVLLRPSTPLDQLPPPGTRIDPSFKPLMATLSPPPDWGSPSRAWRLPLSTPPAASCEAPCTEGWRIVGLEITHPDHHEIPPREARIVSITAREPGQSLVTMDRPMSIGLLQSVAISGSSAPQLNGIHVTTRVSDTSFVVGVEPPDGGASGGHVLQAISIPVESCGPGPQPVCRTVLAPRALRAVAHADRDNLGQGSYDAGSKPVALDGNCRGGRWAARL